MTDADDSIGYAAALDAYRQVGWSGVLPMQRGAKVWPPSIKCADARARKPGHNKDTCPDCISYTGHRGIEPSGADLAAWCEQYQDGNLCLRLPRNDQITVVGIDVDAYGAKTGAHAYAEAVRRWGALPPAPRSSSREGDPMSGIRLFQVPPGTVLQDRINFPELGIGDIEICQYHHRYVIAWPSIHPEGGTYWWRNDAGQLIGIPVPEELPWLPAAWIDGLARAPISLDGDASFDVGPCLTLGDPSIRVQARLGQAIKELNLPGTSRHDTTRKHVLALMRMGKSGEPGVKHALQMLCEMFVAVTSVDHSRHPEIARGEFVRMVTGDTAKRELSQPGFLDWMNDLISSEIENGPSIWEEPSSNDNRTNASSSRVPDQGPRVNSPTPSASHPISHLVEIERGFWESRESLRMIYATAMSRMCPPWAVLAHAAARALVMVRPNAVLPPLIGGPGSLNWFAAIVAASGGGKGASSACAKLLVPGDVESRNVGSGEGMIRAFRAKPSDINPDGRHEALLFTADEIDTLAALNARTASTTLSVLRSAFSGETLGFAYADSEKGRHIPSHSYRMAFVVSVQPKRAGWLLADEGGGTPQRFMWFPGTDSRISKNRPWESGPLTLPAVHEWVHPRELIIPPEAADLILDERVKAMRGDQTALDGHALFCREKFAFALTVLDGRVHMTSEDWELSGIASDVSAYTRDVTVERVKEAAHIDALDRGEVRGVEMAAAKEAEELENAERVRHTLRWILNKITAAGEAGITTRDLQQGSPKSTRKWFQAALQIGQSNGLIRVAEGTTLWTKI